MSPGRMWSLEWSGAKECASSQHQGKQLETPFASLQQMAKMPLLQRHKSQDNNEKMMWMKLISLWAGRSITHKRVWASNLLHGVLCVSRNKNLLWGKRTSACPNLRRYMVWREGTRVTERAQWLKVTCSATRSVHCKGEKMVGAHV